jgi:hypothetical protein
MYINSISALTNLVNGSQATAGKNASSAESLSKPLDTVNTTGSKTLGSAAPQAPVGFADTSLIRAQLETILNSFPPYFPAGRPQRIDQIRGFQDIQDASSPPPAAKAKLAAQKPSEHVADQKTAVAVKDLPQHNNAVAPKSVPAIGKSLRGTLVSLKI